MPLCKKISCPVIQLGLGLESVPHIMGQLGLGSRVVGRLGSRVWVSANFQTISRPLSRLGLGLGSEPFIVSGSV